jgi:transposase
MELSTVRSQSYPTDLTEAQWEIIGPLLPPPKARGSPRRVNLRAVVDGILFLNRSGCQWRLLPRDFPPWQTVYGYFRRFRQAGTWERVHTKLREEVRLEAGRKRTPSAAIIDSQSVKTTEKGGSADMMLAKRSPVGNATSWSIPWASSWPLSCTPPMFRTGMAPNWYWPNFGPASGDSA